MSPKTLVTIALIALLLLASPVPTAALALAGAPSQTHAAQLAPAQSLHDGCVCARYTPMIRSVEPAWIRDRVVRA
jgi:hypothetical protein